MRIAVVHSFYRDAEPSGENTVVTEQVEALSAVGHDVTFLSRHTDHVDSARAYKLRAAWTATSGRGPSPDAELRSFAPDVIHLHNTFPNWGTAWLSEWGDRTVVTLHNYRMMCAAGTLFRDGGTCTECLEKPVVPAIVHRCYRSSRVQSIPVALGTRPGGGLNRIGSSARRLVALNSAAQQIFAQTYGRDVDLVPNFVSAGRKEAASRSYVFVGRFTDEKGILELIEAWPGDVALDIIGTGPLVDAVHATAKRHALIRVLPPMAHAALLERISGYRALIMPSLWSEGLPTVVLEALGRGVPVIMSARVAAASEMSSSGAAQEYEPLDPASLGRALQQVESAGQMMRDAAARLHETMYSRSAWLGRIGELYDQVAISRSEDSQDL